MLDPVTGKEYQTDEQFLSGLSAFDAGNRLAIMGVFAVFGEPKKYLDVGCGTGAMIELARAIGVDAYGVDVLPHPLEKDDYIYRQDLRYPFDAARKFDIVTCIEFVEHIEPEYEGVICDTLARHVSPDGGILVLTSAPPGQDGYHHVNCQPKSYWRARMINRGLHYSDTETRKLAEVWAHTFMVTHWLETNLQVFRRYQ